MVENSFVIRGAVDHHRAEAKSCERHCVNMCGTTKHAEKPSGGADRPPTPADDIQPPQWEQRHHENPIEGGQTSTRHTSITSGHWLGGRTQFKKTEGRRLRGEHAVIYQSFSRLPK